MMELHIEPVDELNFQMSRAVCTKAFGRCIDIYPDIEDTQNTYFHSPVNRMQQGWRNNLLCRQGDEPIAHIAQSVFPVQFEGKPSSLVAIGDVACIVKGTSAIADLFSTALSLREQEGVAFSYLYAFSGRYYAKYGYAYGVKRYRYSFAKEVLPPSCMSVAPYDNADFPQIEAIHAFEMQRYSLVVLREALDWNGLLEYPGNETYVAQDGSGICAYAVVRSVSESEYTFVDCGGVASGLLSIAAYVLDSKAGKVVNFARPMEFGLGDYMDEWDRYPAQERVERAGMVRIVNLAAAMEHHEPTDTSALPFVFSLSDPCIPSNNGTFRYIPRSCRIEASELEPELHLSIDELSYLVCIGVTEESVAAKFPRVSDNLRRRLLILFPKKKVTVFDGF